MILAYICTCTPWLCNLSFFLPCNSFASTDNCTAATLIDPRLQLHATDGIPLEDPSCYLYIMDSLVYLTVTKPDMAHALHNLSQFVSAHTSVHFGHLLRVLRLRGTSSQCWFYAHGNPLQLHAYSDSTWVSNPTDHHSQRLLHSSWFSS
jgi:hypothetical protein